MRNDGSFRDENRFGTARELAASFSCIKTASDVSDLCNKSTLEIGRTLEEDGTRALCTLLREQFRKNDEEILETRHSRTIVSASPCIPGFATATLKCAIDGNGIVVERNSWISVLRLEAAEKYHGVSDERFDTVLVVEKEYGRYSLAREKE